MDALWDFRMSVRGLDFVEILGCHVLLAEGRDLSVLVNYLRVVTTLDVIRTRKRISLRFAFLLEDQDLLAGQVNLLGHFHKSFSLLQIRFTLYGLVLFNLTPTD
jgi:hypothetical protein